MKHCDNAFCLQQDAQYFQTKDYRSPKCTLNDEINIYIYIQYIKYICIYTYKYIYINSSGEKGRRKDMNHYASVFAKIAFLIRLYHPRLYSSNSLYDTSYVYIYILTQIGFIVSLMKTITR